VSVIGADHPGQFGADQWRLREIDLTAEGISVLGHCAFLFAWFERGRGFITGS
jgi:hypothetical protein